MTIVREIRKLVIMGYEVLLCKFGPYLPLRGLTNFPMMVASPNFGISRWFKKEGMRRNTVRCSSIFRDSPIISLLPTYPKLADPLWLLSLFQQVLYRLPWRWSNIVQPYWIITPFMENLINRVFWFQSTASPGFELNKRVMGLEWTLAKFATRTVICYK